MDQARNARHLSSCVEDSPAQRRIPHPTPCPEGEQSFPLPHTEKLIHSLEPECHLSAFEWIDAFLSPHPGLPTTHLI